MSFTSDANSAYQNGAPVSKDDVRALWAAVDGVVTDIGNGRVWHTSSSALSTQTPPAGTDQISVATNGGHITWRRLASAPGTIDPLVHVQTLDGVWWQLSEDSTVIKSRLSVAERSVASLDVGSPSGQDIPAFRSIAMTHTNGVQIWEVTTAPGNGLELDDLKKSADNRWWLRVFDTRFIEYRGTRVYSSRADAASLLASQPPPPNIHRIMSIEGDRINYRSRNEPNNDPLFGVTPYWGIEYAVALVGTAGHPLIVGKPESLVDLIADYGGSASMTVEWQAHETGIGTSGWSVIGTGNAYTVPDSQIGKFLRFRTRGPATNNAYAISNVIGPVVEGTGAELPLDIAASTDGYGQNRVYLPTLHANVTKAEALRGGIGAGPPLDLYYDSGAAIGAGWLGSVTAPLPVTACTLLTTYSPPENVIHPCVVEFYNEFCGWRYVCAITAYPTGPSLEDPFVYGSNDRMHWTFLGGAPQPLDIKLPVTGSYNSDTFLTHDPRTGEIIVGYRRYEPRDGTSSTEENSDVVLLCRTTRNGYSWSPPREIMRIAADQQIMLAPTMIYDPVTNTWHMWVIDRPVMQHWSAPSLYGPWTLDPTTINLAGFNTPHHHEVKWVGDRLICLLYSRDDGNLYFGAFAPGSWNSVTWNMTGVLNPRPSSLYKASFVPVYDPAAETLAFDIWWTAGAAGPAGGTDTGHGRRLQYSRTNAVSVA